MNTFYLIRHGQKENNLGDTPLTPVGVKQAEQTAEYFKNKNLAAIFASPTKRTVQTASIVGNGVGLNIKIDERLIERMNWDDNLKETWEEFMDEWVKTDIDRDYISNRGYSARQIGEKIEAVIREIDKKFENSNILVVAHGGIIGDLLRNNFEEKELPLLNHKLSEGKYIDILECSITIVKLDNDNFVLDGVGDVSHLPIPIS